jgi:hypothetical protein
MNAMLEMNKIDIKALQQAYEGRGPQEAFAPSITDY